MTQQNVAITVVGSDEPGLVNRVSKVIAAQDGNWLHSHMANLAGQFAGIIQVDIAAERLQPLIADLKALESAGLQVQIATTNDSRRITASARQLKMDIVGQDHPGIVSEITHAFYDLGISIEELTTGTSSASMAGGTLFHAQATLNVPESIGDEDLEGVLHNLSNSLLVDIDLEEG